MATALNLCNALIALIEAFQVPGRSLFAEREKDHHKIHNYPKPMSPEHPESTGTTTTAIIHASTHQFLPQPENTRETSSNLLPGPSKGGH